jgi:hypothetical protein
MGMMGFDCGYLMGIEGLCLMWFEGCFEWFSFVSF